MKHLAARRRVGALDDRRNVPSRRHVVASRLVRGSGEGEPLAEERQVAGGERVTAAHSSVPRLSAVGCSSGARLALAPAPDEDEDAENHRDENCTANDCGANGGATKRQ